MPAPELLIPIEANLLADPDDLTTASWTNTAGCSDAASTEYFGTHRFTQVSRTDGTAGRFIDQSAGATYNDGVVGQAIVRKGFVAGNYSAVLLYEGSTFRGAVGITWATKNVTLSGVTAIWYRWLDDSTVWLAIMSTGANVNKMRIQPSEGGTPVAGDYVLVTMAMMEHALVPSYLPLELAARTATTTSTETTRTTPATSRATTSGSRLARVDASRRRPRREPPSPSATRPRSGAREISATARSRSAPRSGALHISRSSSATSNPRGSVAIVPR
jgi:hypothetical protein